MKNGAPGGCPTSNLCPDSMNSGQSQKLAVGSTVKQYVIAAIRNVTQPKVLFTILYSFIVCSFFNLQRPILLAVAKKCKFTYLSGNEQNISCGILENSVKQY